MTTLREALERAAVALGQPGRFEFEQRRGYLYARIVGNKGHESHPGVPCAKNASPEVRAWAEAKAMATLARGLLRYGGFGTASAKVATEGRALSSATKAAERAALALASAETVVSDMEARLAVCRAQRDEARARVEREREALVAAQAAYASVRAEHPQAAEAFDAREALDAALRGDVR